MVYLAVDAFQWLEPRRFRLAASCVPLLVASGLSVWVLASFPVPTHDMPTGFGPDWRCTNAVAKARYCYRVEPAQPAQQTTAPQQLALPP